MKKFRILAAVLLLTIIIASAFSFAACKDPQNELPSGDDGISSGDVTNQGGNGGSDGDGSVDSTTYEKGLSSTSFDFDAEYVYSDWNAQAGYPVFEDKNIVIQPVGYDELNYILNSEGYYLLFFGGNWCPNSTAAIKYVNKFAKQYGITKIYNFDFKLDGGFDLDGNDNSSAAHIRENENSGKLGAEYNYLYGELVERYLTNLNDWVEYKEDGASALTWTKVDGTTKSTVAKVQVPFLFLYNKDNTTHNVPTLEDGKQVGVEVSSQAQEDGKTYPIVYGFEEMVWADAEHIYTDRAKTQTTDTYLGRLEAVYKYIDDNDIEVSEYTDADYFYEAFIYGNGRGHSPKLYDVFEQGEQINLKQITYRELVWLFEQDGNAVILFAGAWCANSTAVVGTINDYAIANDITVYVFDTRLDGKYPIDFWGYGRDRQFQIRETTTPGSSNPNPFAYLYVDLINKYIPNIEVLEGTISYTDGNGKKVEAPRTQLPYLFSYNKDAEDEDGFAAPALAWYEEMLEVVDYDADIYFYKTENYERYTQGIYDVISAYAKRVGVSAKHYTGDPRQPLV